MKRLAVDIVLVPDTHLFEQALAINAQLVKDHGSEIVLHEQDCLPHISLAMGCIDQEDIPKIKQLLHYLWKLYPLHEILHTRGILYKTNSHGQTVSSIELVKDADLQKFHEKVMEHLCLFFKHEATSEMFVGKGSIADSTLAWVNTFKEKSAYDHYWPHITLGYGRAQDVVIRKEFYIDKLMLCQLGNHCTCQKVLVSV